MKRHFNYTNRKRIPRENVDILLTTDGQRPPTFDAKVRLADLKLPSTAKVYVEAYYRTSYMRFDFGTVEDPRCNDDRTLGDIDNRAVIYFRVKVVDPSGDHGKLLADVESVTPIPSEGPGTRTGILDVMFSDLGSQAWSLNLDGSVPTLIVNTRMGVSKEYVRSDETFFALVYPAIVREVLTRAVITDDYRDWDTDTDDWQAMWIGFVCSLDGVDEPPAGDELTSKVDWIESAVRAFCDAQPVCQKYLEIRSAEASK